MHVALHNGCSSDCVYDQVGRLKSLLNKRPGGAPLSWYLFERNKVGCPTRLTYHDGRYRSYLYDDLYRLTSEEHSDAQANSLLWHNYIYDEAGNRLKKLYDSDNEQTADRYTYVYDALNQLSTLTATGTPGDRIDVAGTVADDNLTSVTVYNTTLDPDGEFAAQLRKTLFIARSVDVEEGANDLYALALDKSSNESRYPATGYHTVTLAAPPDPNLEYIFDDNGCLMLIVEGNTLLKEYSYDPENRVVEVEHNEVVVARFQYDGLGRRVVVKLYDELGVLESTTRYIYDGDRVIEEYLDDSGTWVFATAYIHGLGIDNVLAVTHNASGTPSTYFYYHYDGIGSVTELTDSTGALSQAYEYDAWGIATIYDASETAIRNPYLFTGRRWDAALALYYYRARHYDPALGRFLQTDPAGYDAGINLYLYVGATPTAFVDPTGMQGVYRWNGEEYVDVASDPGGILTDPYGNTTLGHINRPRRVGESREPVNMGPPGGEPISSAIVGLVSSAIDAFRYGREEGTKLSGPVFDTPLGEGLGYMRGGMAGIHAGICKFVGDLSGGSRLGKGVFRYDIDGRGHLNADEATPELYAGMRESGVTVVSAGAPAVFPKWFRGLRGAGAADDLARTRVITQDRVVGPRTVARATTRRVGAAGALDDTLNTVDDIVRQPQGQGQSIPKRNAAGGVLEERHVIGESGSKPLQTHHFATNKNTQYTPQMEKIADRYGLDLGGAWNKEKLRQIGRHCNEYHKFVLRGMEQASAQAGASRSTFLDLFEKYVKEPVRKLPELMYKKGWE